MVLARESSFKLRLIDLILRMGRGFYRDFGANGSAWAEGHAGRPGREKTKSRSLVRQKDGGLGMTAMERGRRRDSPANLRRALGATLRRPSGQAAERFFG